MEIKKIPADYASLRGPLVCTVADTAPRTFDVRIIDGNADQTVGVKRLTGVREGSFDLAPCLRRVSSFRPKTGPTGFVTAIGRIVLTRIEVDDLASEWRMFHPGVPGLRPPALLAAFRGTRLLRRTDCDELTLWTADPCRIIATIHRSGASETKEYVSANYGFNIFIVNAVDFPGAESLLLSIPGIGQVGYRFTDSRTGHRLAWRSSAGSIEHYLFPAAAEAVPEVERAQLLTDDGVRPVAVRTRRIITLRSDYEPEKALTALGEIPGSPAVWSVENRVYTPVEVDCGASGFRSHGTLRNLELRIRFEPQTLLP